ncbi:MAG: RNA pseudouridine synthase [Dechloromonas sp.]|jgi:tRNA pseudouridine32 synthase/23S rRNA pseudouridine746 synthase|nr:RNA pseudouridine synthase [Dechloromonas sp.]
MSDHSPTYQPPPDAGLDIRYLDDDLLVVDKPAGLLSVPGRGPDKQDCLSARVQARYPEALPVHRLDLGTSGLLVLARGPEMHRALNRLFATRGVEKRYVALVAGRMEASEQVIDLPLIADWPNRPLQMVDHAIGKPSRTRLRVVGHEPWLDATRVDLFPETGRSHQLRVHLQAIGYPILGDEFYAPPEVFARATRLLLHATVLAFRHPSTATALRVESPAPF